MRYVIWHCGRDGSNMLLSLLHQTGVAGISDYEKGGYHVGYEAMSLPEFKQRTTNYFKAQETPNGVQGCKAGFDYVDQIRKFVKNWAAIDYWIEGFDKHLVLSRYSKTRQAVSMLFAGHTKQWASYSPTTPYTPPTYDECAITSSIAELVGRETRRNTYLDMMHIRYKPIFYEDIVKYPEYILADIMDYLGIHEPYTFKGAHTEKQSDPLKEQYIERYIKTSRTFDYVNVK